MIVRIIDVYVKDDRVEDFSTATRKNHAGSTQEPGVLRFDVLQDNSDSSHFVLYEVYESEEATVRHKETAHYIEWKAAVESMMAKSRGSTACRVIAPLEPERW